MVAIVVGLVGLVLGGAIGAIWGRTLEAARAAEERAAAAEEGVRVFALAEQRAWVALGRALEADDGPLADDARVAAAARHLAATVGLQHRCLACRGSGRFEGDHCHACSGTGQR